ncbi:MAG: hypothetical protein K2M97_01610, partial [Muribaculaceae bacterium]|nr:hypothetical protein [Muribaculaceae bacterium]
FFFIITCGIKRIPANAPAGERVGFKHATSSQVDERGFLTLCRPDGDSGIKRRQRCVITVLRYFLHS